MKFETVDKGEKRFTQLLWGRSLGPHIAVPVKSRNISSDKEKVTFKIIEKPTLHERPWTALLMALLRPRWLLAAVMPVAATVQYGIVKYDIALDVSVLLCVLAVIGLHVFALSWNDIQDYVQGVDRLNPYGGSQILPQGWMTAEQLLKVSIGALLFAVICAVPLLRAAWVPLGALALLIGLIMIVYSIAGSGLKAKGLGEMAIFFAYGPLIALGVSWTLMQSVDLFILLTGGIWGHWSVVQLQIRQTHNLMYDALAKNKTFAVRVGFDRMKTFLLIQGVVHILLFMVLGWHFQLATKWLTVIIVFEVLLMSCFVKSIRRLSSPLSSYFFNVQHVVTIGYFVHYLNVILMIYGLRG